jgi:hypothetical protein
MGTRPAWTMADVSEKFGAWVGAMYRPASDVYEFNLDNAAKVELPGHVVRNAPDAEAIARALTRKRGV